MIDGSYIHVHQDAFGARNSAGNQAIGRSRGGQTSKIHLVIDGDGFLRNIKLTSGNIHDIIPAGELLRDCFFCTILADKGYDGKALVNQLSEQQCTAVIPSRSNSKHPRELDKVMYKQRHLIENFFGKVKRFRRIATRYDKLASTYLFFFIFASLIISTR